jgi:gamma-glutamyl-gamma-aminobutyrate hydrolase PuuD
VQWHPEALVENSEASRRLFASFVDAATDYREQRVARDEWRVTSGE